MRSFFRQTNFGLAERVAPMAIEDELSSDIAIALLAGKERDPERLKTLKEVVLRIDMSLRQVTQSANRISFKAGRKNTVRLKKAR